MILKNVSAAIVMLWLASANAQLEPITRDNVVTGEMTIDFDTRVRSNQNSDGSVKQGVVDTYSLDLKLPSDFSMSANVTRQPRVGSVWSAMNLADEQRAGFKYGLNLSYKGNAVGSLVGFISVDENGRYNLEDQKSPLRIDIQKGKRPYVSNFKGSIQGVAIAGSSDASDSITRKIKIYGQKDGQKAVREVSVEPFDVNRLVLAQGPHPTIHPETRVEGSFNYDPETYNYYPRLKMTYQQSGKEKQDVIEGNIRWNDEESRYEFNVTFAKESVEESSDVAMFFEDSAASEDTSMDDDFFAADSSVPALSGYITYVDSGSDANGAPLNSQITYNLNANQLTETQIMNFMKFWVLAIGPTNDE